MKIGIIGSGIMGSTIARHLVSLGHHVSVANSRGPQSLTAFAEENKVKAETVKGVVLDKDIVVISLPQDAILNLPQDLFEHCAVNTIVVDTGNYYPGIRDAEIVEIEKGMPESEWVSQVLSIPIIKAFNNITTWNLSTCGVPSGSAGRLCLPVAGNNSKDKKTVLELINQFGFDGIDAGKLADSWRQQPGSPAYCNDLDLVSLIDALKKAEYSKIAEYRMNAMAEAKRMVEEAGSLAEAVANTGKK